MVLYRNLRQFSVVQLELLLRFPTKTEGEIFERHIWHILRLVLLIEFRLSQTSWLLIFGSFINRHTICIWNDWIGRAAPGRFPCNSRTARGPCLPMNQVHPWSFIESSPVRLGSWRQLKWRLRPRRAVGTEFFIPGARMHWGEWSQLNSKETSM